MKEIIFDKGPNGARACFDAPEYVISLDSGGDVEAAFAAIDEAQSDGLWLAGVVYYELWQYLEGRGQAQLSKSTPLIRLGAFEKPNPFAEKNITAHQLGDWNAGLTFEDYAPRFDAVKSYIEAGDVYQINLTFPVFGAWSGDAFSIYETLRARQEVSYGAFVDFGDGDYLLSRSPELFFETKDGDIRTKPMKGTRPRGTAYEDLASRAFLQFDVKSRAENLMIVDLLRNDISRICETGSVKVPKLFAVEEYATVLQMVSEIKGRLTTNKLSEQMRALFPCGSVTGAPKIRAMEIIDELEIAPRGAYCGAIGWASPDGHSCFNVAIRTIALEKNGGAQLNIGGGLVYDSKVEEEYEECLWKMRYAQD